MTVVVQINDYEWWYGPSVQEVLAYYEANIVSLEDDDCYRVLSECELRTMKGDFSDEGSGEPEIRTFAEELSATIAKAGPGPALLACLEW